MNNNKMEKIKNLFFAALCCVAMVSMTSCLNSDDDNNYNYIPLTQYQKMQMVMRMTGSYTGKAVLWTPNGYSSLSAVDSADVRFAVMSDSTILVQNFPLRLLCKSTSSSDLKKQVQNATAELKGVYTLYKPWGADDSYVEKVYPFSFWKSNKNEDWQQSFPVVVSDTTNVGGNQVIKKDTVNTLTASFNMQNASGYSTAIYGYVPASNMIQFGVVPTTVTAASGGAISTAGIIMITGKK